MTWSPSGGLIVDVPDHVYFTTVSVRAYDGSRHDEVSVDVAQPDDEVGLDLIVDELRRQGRLDLAYPISLQPMATAYNLDGWAVGEASTRPLEVLDGPTGPEVLPDVLVPLPAFLVDAVPAEHRATAMGRRSHIVSRQVEPTEPTADLDNSDKLVDHVPVTEGNHDLVRTLPSREAFKAALETWPGDRSLDEVYDELLERHQAPEVTP